MEAKPAFRDTGTLPFIRSQRTKFNHARGFLVGILRVIPLKETTKSYLILPVLILYALATGLGPSCVRALVMSVLVVCAFWIRRPAIILNSLSLAAILLFLTNTNSLSSSGFNFHSASYSALAIFSPLLARCLARATFPDPLLPPKLWTQPQQLTVQIGRPVTSALSATSVSWIAGLPWSFSVFQLTHPSRASRKPRRHSDRFFKSLSGISGTALRPAWTSHSVPE